MGSTQKATMERPPGHTQQAGAMVRRRARAIASLRDELDYLRDLGDAYARRTVEKTVRGRPTDIVVELYYEAMTDKRDTAALMGDLSTITP